MPYEVQHDPEHPGRFRVVNTDTGHVHGKRMTKTGAVKQWRLLEALEHDPGWKPAPGAVSTLKHVPHGMPGTGH